MRKISGLIILIGAICLSFVATASSQPSISIIPETSNVVNAGDTFTVNVVLSNNTEIGGMQFNVEFDDESLEYVSGEVVGVFGVSNLTLSETGIVRVNCMSESVLSNDALFSITFRAKATTTLIKKSTLTLTEIVAGNLSGFDVECTKNDLDIAIKNESAISFDSREYTYDGVQKELLISGILPDGASVEYLNNTATNAGEYNATANISFSYDYAVIEPLILNANLTINKAEQAMPAPAEITLNYFEETISFGIHLEANLKEDFSGAEILSGSKIQPDTKIYISKKETENYNRGLPLEYVISPRPLRPAAPALAGKTAASVTLETVSGAEYRLGDGRWQDLPVFSDLLPEQEYTFYIRIKATGASFCSEISLGSSYTTDSEVEEGYAFEIYITSAVYNKTTQNAEILIDINNLRLKQADAMLSLAIYDKQSKLVKMVSEKITINENGISQLQKSIALSAALNSGYKVKAFLWSGFEQMLPLAEVAEMNFAGYAFEINILSAEYNKSTKYVDTQISINNFKSQAESGRLSVAVYDSQNRLVKMVSENITIDKNGISQLQKSIAVPTVPNSGYKVKAFLWSGFEQMLPLAETAVKNLEGYDFEVNISGMKYNNITQSIDTQISINNFKSQATGGRLSVALYDTQGKLIKIVSENITIDENGIPQLQKSIAVSSAPNSGYMLKAFLWSGFEQMQPLANTAINCFE